MGEVCHKTTCDSDCTCLGYIWAVCHKLDCCITQCSLRKFIHWCCWFRGKLWKRKPALLFT